MIKFLLSTLSVFPKWLFIGALLLVVTFNVNAQTITPQDGDYRSIGGTVTNPNPWLDADTWEKYNGSGWIDANDFPLSGAFNGTVFIQSGTFVEYNVDGMTNGFNLTGAIVIDGNFLVDIPSNSNTNFAGDINVFELNDGGVFRTTFGNNPKLEVRIQELFRINGGELRYQNGGNNSALFIECKGDVEVNGGLVIDDRGNGLNTSGLYMSGDGTSASPQHLKIISNVSPLARERFFATTSTYIVEEYAGSIEQNTVYGDITGEDIRTDYIGLEGKGDILTINNSSVTGVNLNRNKTVSDTLKLFNGTLNYNTNDLNIATDATIERTGGNLNTPPTSFGTSLNLLYSDHTSPVTMANEVPTADIIENLTINTTNSVLANTDLKINSTIDLTNGILQLNIQKLSVGENIIRSSGNIDATDAVVEFTSSTNQSLAISSFIDNTIKHIINSGSGGPNLSSELKVSDLLEVNAGDFKSNGHLVMLASPTNTSQVGPVDGSITGEVTVEQYYPARRAFRLISPSVTTSASINANWQEGASDYLDNPEEGYGTHITGSTTGANGFDETPSGNPSLFTFDNINRGWIAVAGTESQTLTAGSPYRLMIRGDRSIDVTSNDATPTNTRLRTTGALNIGSQSQLNISPISGDLSFIANPYHAQVDMSSVLTNSTNLSTTEYYIWDPTLGGNDGRGAYVTIDPATGDNALSPNTVDPGGNFSDANQFLQPMQAAFVRTGNAVDAPSINFKESDKNVSPAQTETKSFSQKEYINVMLFDADSYAEGSSPSDGLRINFNDSYSVTAKDDSPKLGNLDENLARIEGNDYASIERRPYPSDEERLELFVNQYRNESYVLKFELTDNLNTKVFIEDKYLNQTKEITVSDNTYAFEIDESISESKASDRFSIVLNPVSLSTVDESFADINLYPNPTKDNFRINGPDLAQGAQVEIYNLLGQQVYKRDFKGQSTIEINGFNFNTGIYLIKIETHKGKTTLKLVKK
jgi:hypothetical protein